MDINPFLYIAVFLLTIVSGVVYIHFLKQFINICISVYQSRDIATGVQRGLISRNLTHHFIMTSISGLVLIFLVILLVVMTAMAVGS